MISEISPNPKSRGNGAPVTVTAVYLAHSRRMGEDVESVDQHCLNGARMYCIRMTGGWMVEPVEDHTGYFVYIGGMGKSSGA
ncbi:uncharacterized protein N7498_010507 [Penicillium cinerascens]|uniref:Uncharacterized protein n=1 Tax=Penicillium cinerascens TaxID=70096 RepID=A0A9W9J7U9_9EURO|nr:uncharacterized protein N7498_010507 [Penicillium cinerascens]KAJ5191522.1 hypothetical protein N7498_010507 [Penicillium cinerascens]